LKIKTFILIVTLVIVGITVFVVFLTGLYSLQGEFHSEFMANGENGLKDFNSDVLGLFYQFSGQIDYSILEIVHGGPVEQTLEKMKDSSEADWAFITIDSKNYIYPSEPGAESLVARSRPWYIAATSHPQNIVGNEFYSPTLSASVVMMSIDFNENGKTYVGGLIFKEDSFFRLLSGRFGGKPFIIMRNGKVIYPSQISYDSGKGIMKLNGENYSIYSTNYDDLLLKDGIVSSMKYEVGMPVSLKNIANFMTGTIYALLAILIIASLAEIIMMMLVARRIGRSVEVLADISDKFDLANGKMEIDERSEKIASNFKETEKVYSKMSELFQEVEAQIEELRATNEELESSYEEIEQLSNSLSRETQELKDLSEASNLISLSGNNSDSIKILLDKLMKIYNCNGITIIDVEKNSVIDSVGMKFELPNLLANGKSIVNGKIISVPSSGKNILIVPIIFESRLLATIEMIFEGQIPTESEQESLKRFTIDFASSLNSQKLISEIENSYVYLASKFAEISEIYDYETGSHIQRVGEYSAFIARKMRMNAQFEKDIRTYATIHDIGKLKVPREILTKNGPLSSEEFEEMKKHTIYGEQLLGDEPFLEMARHIARYHHEKYDGSGYPDGLKGDGIPIEARITAIADIYDALRSPRRYKKAFTHEETVKIILEGDGRVKPEHFDPVILEIFRVDNAEFSRIYESLLDEEE
jgi:HD-GYP domain-containing protein (c-di-GMP phosphodiesterase class II)